MSEDWRPHTDAPRLEYHCPHCGYTTTDLRGWTVTGWYSRDGKIRECPECGNEVKK